MPALCKPSALRRVRLAAKTGAAEMGTAKAWNRRIDRHDRHEAYCYDGQRSCR